MEENKKFNAELEIVRFEDTDVITASPYPVDLGCPVDLGPCPVDLCSYDLGPCPFDLCSYYLGPCPFDRGPCPIHQVY